MGKQSNVLVIFLVFSLSMNVFLKRKDLGRALTTPPMPQQQEWEGRSNTIVNNNNNNNNHNYGNYIDETNNHNVGNVQDTTNSNTKDDTRNLLESNVVQEMIRDEVARVMANFSKTLLSQQPPPPPPQSLPPLPPSPPQKQESALPTCKSLMQGDNSPYKDGAFLTRHTLPVSWIPRADGSRELRHSMCDLHRYSAAEAKQCLKGKHVNLIGDSLTRYQYLSLAWFVHKAAYPPRFGIDRGKPKCTHIDETGHPTCSTNQDPNICVEGDWRSSVPPGRSDWQHYMQSIGGATIFGGHMESAAIRTAKLKADQAVENNLYVSPVIDDANNNNNNNNNNNDDPMDTSNKLVLSYVKENGFGKPLPLIGWNFTGCAYTGTCTYPDELADRREAMALNASLDFSQPLTLALNESNGILRSLLPPVDVAIYNRGLWGPLQPEIAATVLPQLYTFSGGDRGKCYYRTTTGKLKDTLPRERNELRSSVIFKAGCGYMDFAHLLQDFGALTFFHPPPPPQAHFNGKEVTQAQQRKLAHGNLGKNPHTISILDERRTVFWDAVHFQPWVYEELNNIMLNILCNGQT